MNSQNRLAGDTGFADHIYKIRVTAKYLLGPARPDGVIALAIPNLMGG